MATEENKDMAEDQSSLPSNLPRLKRPTSTKPSSADDFISEFEKDDVELTHIQSKNGPML